MPRIIIALAAFGVALVFLPCLVSAQTKDEGTSLYNDALELQQKARTREDEQKAVQKYEQALKIFEKVKFDRGIGLIFNNLGITYYHWGQNQKAMEFYRKAADISRKVGDLKLEGQVFTNLGNLSHDWCRYTAATQYHEKSLEISKQLGNPKTEAIALNNLGAVYKDWARPKKAIEFYEKSLEISRKLRDQQIEGSVLLNLGNVYNSSGDNGKAAEYYEKSLKISRNIGDLKLEGNALNHLANLYRTRGHYDKAVEFHEKSVDINIKLGNAAGQSLSLGGLATDYFKFGQYQKAVELYQKSLDLSRRLGDWKAVGRTQSDLALVYYALGQHDKGLDTLSAGKANNETHGLSTRWVNDLIGNLYLELNDMSKAEPLIKAAGYNDSQGRLCLLKSDYAGAKNYYEKLREAAEKNRDADNLFTAYAGLGVAYEGMGDNPKAVENYRKAFTYTEDFRSTLTRDKRESFFDVRIGGFYRTVPYEGLARVALKTGKPVEALKESEQARARTFIEAISKRDEHVGLDVPKIVREKDSLVINQLAALSENLQNAYEKQNKELIASLEPQVKEAKQRLAAHVDMLRKQYPLFAATKYPQPMSLDQTALKENEWVLAYHVTDPGLIVYLTKEKNLVKAEFKPVTRKDIDALVRKFREPLEVKPEDTPERIAKKLKSFDFQTGKKLSDILLVDILPSLPKDAQVIVVPDDCLGVLPFEMLPLNDGGKIAFDGKSWKSSGAEFFGDRNPISYYQSITALTLARTYGKSKSKAEKILVMDDPVFGPDDPRLKSMAQANKQKLMDSLPQNLMSIKTDLNMTFPRLSYTGDLGKSLKSLDSSRTEEHTGMEAAKQVLFKKPLDSYGAMIFATHGYFGKDLPGIMEPVLVLTLVDQPKGQDGFLRLSEVMGLKINADLVALTACQTGLGRKISGEGTMGMGRAFQYAGARCVLVSLWSVSEKASVNLVENFFKHMKDGKNKLDALKLARKEIRERGFDHPFYWAPFILVGEVN